MKFTTAPGARFNQKDAEIIGAEVTRLIERDGMVKPEILVDEAKVNTSPMHHYFEWDDSVAAQRYRIEQARYMLRHVEVIIERSEKQPIVSRAFVHVQSPTTHGFLDVRSAMENPEYRNQVVGKALSDLQVWRERYLRITELSDLFTAIDKAVVKIRRATVRASKTARA